ncbi:MAG: polyphenol oxidase family protein [Deltaproteobacteria bacterium]|jgi:YfiH family protein|nr:polyphenol oxidase family protein [Deltaproteobacteria bacterium]
MDKTPLKDKGFALFPRFMPFAFPGLPGVRCLFGTALAGNLSLETGADQAETAQIRAFRRLLLEECALSAWSELRQVHGDAFLRNPEPTDPESPPSLEADGQFTDKIAFGLILKTADCQPLFLTNAKGTAVAALHVGWRGNVLNFPAKGLADFCRACACPPSEVLAARGPSLGPGAAQFINFEQEWGPAFLPWFDAQRRTMDLWSLSQDQLVRAGVQARNIFRLDLCTGSLPGLFFSHRRGDAGRQISIIWREESALTDKS